MKKVIKKFYKLRSINKIEIYKKKTLQNLTNIHRSMKKNIKDTSKLGGSFTWFRSLVVVQWLSGFDGGLGVVFFLGS